MSKVLLIGGTDPSGAGVQTDWQVVHALNAEQANIQASSVITAVTSQNSEGVYDQGILPRQQITSQFNTLKNEPFSAIKIGMLGNAEIVQAVVEFIQNHAQDIPVILDPVLASSSGGELLDGAGTQALISQLLPLVTLITPNIHELESLVGISINSYDDLENAAQQLITFGAKNVLVKGGHFRFDEDAGNKDTSSDYFISSDGSANIKGEEEDFYLKGIRWKNRSNVRGTGCSLATATACQLSLDFPLNDAVVYAKALISNGIRNAIEVNNEQRKLHFLPYDTQHPFELMDMPKLLKSADLLSERYGFASCNSKSSNNSLGIYPVVDSVEWLEKLIPLGIETIQLRIKDKNPSDVEDDIIAAIKLGHEHNIRLFINDYWPLAVKHEAYGIHLGQEDLDDVDMAKIAESGCRLGVSTHSYTEVARALAIDPSYLALGPIFATSSKIMPWIPQGVSAVEKWVGLLSKHYPLVAIGGINYSRAKALKETGIGSVAMISEITQADDYVKSTQDLLALWQENS